jgi:uncharacterized protein (TIGR02996 family)
VIVVMFGPPGATLTSVAVRRDEVTIGSDRQVDIFVPHAEPIHARLVADGKQWLIVTSAPTVINGRQVEGRFVVDAEDEILIGGYVVAIRPVELDAREQELIASAVRDDDARLIYADWLEERGQWDRAEFLRLQSAAYGLDPMSPRFQSLALRIKKLSPALDLTWRMMLSRDDVEGCRSVSRELTCTMNWSFLEPTNDPTVRSCGGCRQHVYYCATEEQAAEHARAGHCIVIDLGATRGELLAGALRLAERDRQLATAPVINAPPTPPGTYLPVHYTLPPQPPPVPPPPEPECTNCNAPMTPAMRYCPVCGMPR